MVAAQGVRLAKPKVKKGIERTVISGIGDDAMME
jgi:hypothetical protein